MSVSIVVPDVLKAVKPYITLASQLDDKDKIIAYYCRLHALQQGMKINKTLPECKQFLMKMMDILEKLKVTLKNEDAIKTELVGQAFVEKYTLGLFISADQDDRASKFSMNLVKRFYTVGLLFDVLSYFGDLNEDISNKRDYSKRKAVYIKKCLESGETPIAGPPTDTNDDIPIINNSSNHNDTSSSSTNNNNYNLQQETTTYKVNNSDTIAKAEKLCKFASNALHYEDIPTAIDNLEKCLQLLKATTQSANF